MLTELKKYERMPRVKRVYMAAELNDRRIVEGLIIEIRTRNSVLIQEEVT